MSIECPNVEAAKKLAEKISELSEEIFSAGWMSQIEYQLWALMLARDASEPRGEYWEYMNSALAELHRLSHDCFGWVVWVDNDRPHLREKVVFLESGDGTYQTASGEQAGPAWIGIKDWINENAENGLESPWGKAVRGVLQ